MAGPAAPSLIRVRSEFSDRLLLLGLNSIVGVLGSYGYSALDVRGWGPTMRETLNLLHLPSHLSEACVLIAAGLVRLRRHTVEELARDAADARDLGEVSLHLPAHQSGHAKPRDKELA